MSDIEERLARIESKFEQISSELENISNGRFDEISLSKGINLLDDAGNLKFTVRMLNEIPVMRFWGSDGESGIFVSAGDGSPEILLSDDKGRGRLKIKLGEGGRPMLVMMDDQEIPRVSASIIDNVPRIMLNDGRGILRMVLCADDAPHFQIFDEEKTTRVNISLGASGALAAIADEYGNIIGILE